VTGLYIHVPFRLAERPYDESAVTTDLGQRAAYVRAVCAEIRHVGRRYGGDAPLDTVYVGGGRPSLLAPADLEALHDAVGDAFALGDAGLAGLDECTIEVDPADATPDCLRALRTLGFDRLSLPVLSGYADDLEAVSAGHTPDDTDRALDAVADLGFASLDATLLFGWYGQEAVRWKATVQQMARRAVPHLSLMEWTAATPPPGSEEAAADAYTFASDYLQTEGYAHYEISHLARPGYRSLHNASHWRHGNVLGVGPGARSFWWPVRSDAPDEDAAADADGAAAPLAMRWTNVRNTARYVALVGQGYAPQARGERLTRADLAAEYVLLRLRTREGLDLSVLRNRYGTALDDAPAEALDQLYARGYVKRVDDTVRLTRKGWLVYDSIAGRLLPEA
jgi:oxygen-independent coproporphyrinogen-3 oxidase